MTQNTGKYRGQKIYHFVYHELIMAARYRGCDNLSGNRQVDGLPMSGNYHGQRIRRNSGRDFHRRECDNKRPMLSALAVGVSGEPGDGFYSWAKELGRLQDDSKEGRRKFWEQEKQAVYEDLEG